jgi:hypothetical protein
MWCEGSFLREADPTDLDPAIHHREASRAFETLVDAGAGGSGPIFPGSNRGKDFAAASAAFRWTQDLEWEER